VERRAASGRRRESHAHPLVVLTAFINYLVYGLVRTRTAIQRAMNNEPTVGALIANRHTIKHDMDDWS